MRILLSLILLATLVYSGLCLFLYINQRNMLYYPVSSSEPADLMSLQLDAGGESLNAWVMNPGQSKAVLYFGGNAEAVASNAGLFRNEVTGYSVYFTEYRGYGRSTGKPTEQGLMSDALAWYDLVARQHKQVAVIGRSLGSAVALRLASERKVSRLVLVTPFDSAAKLAAHYYPLFPVSLLLKDRYDSVKLVHRLSLPVLAIAAEDDEIIPYARTRALLKALPAGELTTVIIKNTGHNDLSTNPVYISSISRFLAAKNRGH